MKKLIITLIVFGLLYLIMTIMSLAPQTTTPSDQVSALAVIEGMTCEGCSNFLEKKIKTIPEVINVSINHQIGKAKLTGKPNLNLELISQLINDSGYRVAQIEFLE